MEFETSNACYIHPSSGNVWGIDYTNIWGWGKCWLDCRRNLQGITGSVMEDKCDERACNCLVPFRPRYENKLDIDMSEVRFEYELARNAIAKVVLEYELGRSSFMEGSVAVSSNEANKGEDILPIGYERVQKLDIEFPSSQDELSSSSSNDGKQLDSSSSCPQCPTKGILSIDYERGQKLNIKSPTTQDALSSSSSDDGKELDSSSSFSPPKAPLTTNIIRVPGRYCDISARSPKYKTELCLNYLKDGTCKMGDRCEFAHGDQELRPRFVAYNFQSKVCNAFRNTGRCPYGTRCTYKHV